MKTLDTVILRGGKVWLSEQEADPDALYAKFLVCDFSVNGNGVRLDRDTIDAWVSTLKDQPLVGKIAAKSDGSMDLQAIMFALWNALMKRAIPIMTSSLTPPLWYIVDVGLRM